MKDFQILLSLLHASLVKAALSATEGLDGLGDVQVELSIVAMTPAQNAALIDAGQPVERFKLRLRRDDDVLMVSSSETVRGVWVSFDNWAMENGIKLDMDYSAFAEVVNDVTLRNFLGKPTLAGGK